MVESRLTNNQATESAKTRPRQSAARQRRFARERQVDQAPMGRENQDYEPPLGSFAATLLNVAFALVPIA